MAVTASPRIHSLLAWLVLLVALTTTALLAWHSVSDRDIWLHQRAGRDILEQGAVSRTNTFSFTADRHPWLNHEWLFQVLVAATGPGTDGQGPGPDGVRGWHLLRVGLALALMATLLLGDGGVQALRGHRPLLTTALTAAAVLGALGLLWTRLILRPELVSALLLVLILRSVESVARHGVPRPWSWLDPRRGAGQAFWLTVLWAQIHGFAVLAPLLWLLAMLAALVARPLRAGAESGQHGVSALQGLLPGALLACAALVLTPNGPAGALYSLQALGQFGADGPRLDRVVAELVPTLATRDALGATRVLFLACLGWSAVWIVWQWGRIPLLRVLFLALAAAAALAGQRGLGPFAVSFVLLHTGAAQELRGLPGWRPGPRFAPVLATALLSISVLFSILWWARIADDRFYLSEGVARRWGEGLTPAHAPVETARAVGNLGPVRVVANIDAAGCLLAHGRPRLFIDGRTEAYPPALWQTYAILRGGGPEAMIALSRQNPDAVCLTLGGAFRPLVDRLAASPEWSLTHVGPAAVVFRPAEEAAPGANPVAVASALIRRAADEPATARGGDLALAAANLFRLAGRPDRAETALAAAARRRPDHAVVRHNLGNILLEAGDPAAARPHFLAALAVNGRLAGAALNAGVCAARSGRTADALEDLGRAVAIDPDLFGAWANLGTLREATGDAAGALEAFRQALRLRPGDAALRARTEALAGRPTR